MNPCNTWLHRESRKYQFRLKGAGKHDSECTRRALVESEPPVPPEEKPLTLTYLALRPVTLHCSWLLHSLTEFLSKAMKLGEPNVWHGTHQCGATTTHGFPESAAFLGILLQYDQRCYGMWIYETSTVQLTFTFTFCWISVDGAKCSQSYALALNSMPTILLKQQCVMCVLYLSPCGKEVAVLEFKTGGFFAKWGNLIWGKLRIRWEGRAELRRVGERRG